MAIYQLEDWSLMDVEDTERSFKIHTLMDKVVSGSVFICCKMPQFAPHTTLFEGKTKIRCIGCNIINVDLPMDSGTIMCNQAQITYEMSEDYNLIIKDILQKNEYTEISHTKLLEIFASDKITNKKIKEIYKSLIKEARGYA